jgi:GNAT superfamily N-acetyltransferase
MVPVIRLAAAPDAETIVSILIASKEASFRGVIDAHDRDAPFWIRRWRGYIATGSQAQESLGDGWAFIAEQSGVPVGFAAYHHTRRHKTDAELQGIYVLKEWQRQGIGAHLLGTIAHRLAADGSRSMCVGFDPNFPYKQFYFKYGAIEIAPDATWAIWPDLHELGARLPRPSGELLKGLRKSKRRLGGFWPRA